MKERDCYIAHASNIDRGTFRIYMTEKAGVGQMTLTNNDLKFAGETDELAHVWLASGIIMSSFKSNLDPIILVNTDDYNEEG